MYTVETFHKNKPVQSLPFDSDEDALIYANQLADLYLAKKRADNAWHNTDTDINIEIWHSNAINTTP